MLPARAYDSKRIWGPPRAKILDAIGIDNCAESFKWSLASPGISRGSILHERKGDSDRVAPGRDGRNGGSGDPHSPSRDADQRPARPGDRPDDGARRGGPRVRPR